MDVGQAQAFLRMVLRQHLYRPPDLKLIRTAVRRMLIVEKTINAGR
jgi:hypothetical protein